MKPAGVIRIVAIADLLITGMFALPVLAELMLAFLFWLNNLIGPELPVPETTALNMLFINLMGTLGVVWALARMAKPYETLGIIDAWARLWVAGLIVYYLTRPDVPVILTVFIATELIGAWAQLWALRNLPD